MIGFGTIKSMCINGEQYNGVTGIHIEDECVVNLEPQNYISTLDDVQTSFSIDLCGRGFWTSNYAYNGCNGPLMIEWKKRIMIQKKWHKRKRINKKWLKQYGMIQDYVDVAAEIVNITQVNPDKNPLYMQTTLLTTQPTEFSFEVKNIVYKWRPEQRMCNRKVDLDVEKWRGVPWSIMDGTC